MTMFVNRVRVERSRRVVRGCARRVEQERSRMETTRGVNRVVPDRRPLGVRQHVRSVYLGCMQETRPVRAHNVNPELMRTRHALGVRAAPVKRYRQGEWMGAYRADQADTRSRGTRSVCLVMGVVRRTVCQLRTAADVRSATIRTGPAVCRVRRDV
jgi:hypothetical protein